MNIQTREVNHAMTVVFKHSEPVS